MKKLQAAIVGASGYAGEELVRLLARHPHLELAALSSRSSAGKTLGDVIPGTPAAVRGLKFESITPDDLAARTDIDVTFLALPHGVAAEYAVPLRAAGKVVVDLSADFRLKSAEVYKEFYAHEHPAPHLLAQSVYAQPELHRDEIAKSDLLACPGCYPTSILLPLAPVLRAGVIDSASIVINSLSGASGAGKKADISLLFCEIQENMRAYSVPKHRHLSEIEQELTLAAGSRVTVTFIPHLIPLHRGMLSTITAKLTQTATAEEVTALLTKAYGHEPFVRVLPVGKIPEVVNVVRTNVCEISVQVDTRTGRLILLSAIDNLSKGASAQAVQAMNVRFGFPETSGLEI
ncbi:MAG: N-acetyl-gamma-glutamyl-phosphate reductase [Candidatus Methylacidiphilales bacterium]|nr:N-acetyl-gamma-glutamyl-phosphate reductase [Candidatus Methylacidiphilales bacterium]